mgnify:CR=1 FL=1
MHERLQPRVSEAATRVSEAATRVSEAATPPLSSWGFAFAPRWTVEMCLEGTSFLVPFKLVLRLRGLSLRGELAASFPPNLAYAVICFREFPEVRCLPPPTHSMCMCTCRSTRCAPRGVPRSVHCLAARAMHGKDKEAHRMCVQMHWCASRPPGRRCLSAHTRTPGAL